MGFWKQSGGGENSGHDHDKVEITGGKNETITHVQYPDKSGGTATVTVTDSGHTTIHGSGDIHYHDGHATGNSSD